MALGKAKLFRHKNMTTKDQSAQSRWLIYCWEINIKHADGRQKSYFADMILLHWNYQNLKW
jgi:hypothetical protein